MIREFKAGDYRLYSRKLDPRTVFASAPFRLATGSNLPRREKRRTAGEPTSAARSWSPTSNDVATCFALRQHPAVNLACVLVGRPAPSREAFNCVSDGAGNNRKRLSSGWASSSCSRTTASPSGTHQRPGGCRLARLARIADGW